MRDNKEFIAFVLELQPSNQLINLYKIIIKRCCKMIKKVLLPKKIKKNVYKECTKYNY